MQEFVNKLKQVLLKPQAFFQKMPSKAMVFFAIILSINVIARGLINLLIPNTGITLLGETGMKVSLVSTLIDIPINFIYGFIGIFVGAAIIYVLAKLFNGKASWEKNLDMCFFAAAPVIFSWVPVIGWIASIWILVLVVVGLMKVHKLDMMRAIAIVVLPLLILGLLGFLFLGALIGNLFGSLVTLIGG